MNKDVLKELHFARLMLEEATEKRKKALKLFEESPDYQMLLKIEQDYKDSVNAREEAFRDAAYEEYFRTEEKKGTGYSIRVMTNVNIPDEKAAFEWCLKNFTPSLKLDAKTFKTAAKNGTVPDELAQITEEAKVYIDSDLSGIE